MAQKGKLYLIPSPLGEGGIKTLPEYTKQAVYSLKCFIVEKAKTARRFLKHIDYPHDFDEIDLYSLDKRTTFDEIFDFVQIIVSGTSMGLMSESGTPCVGDPGALVVDLAHQFDIQVIPMTGPSSIILALMASGMNGQNFAFNGYLPIQSNERKKRIAQLEQLSIRNDQTQIFIETPYRNMALLKDILDVCRKDTKLCLASNLTLSNEYVKTKSIERWKRGSINLHKKPTVFLLFHG